jgi:hypothetical protein
LAVIFHLKINVLKAFPSSPTKKFRQNDASFYPVFLRGAAEGMWLARGAMDLKRLKPTALGCSHGLAHSIVDDHLKFRKIYARWMPRELKHRKNEPNVSVLATSLTVWACS